MSLEHIFPGDSELARRMRAIDWAQTELGEPDQWPANLRVALGICLTSRFPMSVWWGSNLTLFYNDAYIPFLGPKHPAALARPGRDAWAEVWHQIGPMIENVFATGEASWSEDMQMFYARAVPNEEVYVTFSLSPVYSAGTVDGIFCACTESTEKILGSRRLDMLRELAVSATVAHSVDEALEAAAEVLGNNPHTVPFAAIYAGSEEGVELRSATRVDLMPSTVRASDHDDLLRIAAVLRGEQTVEVDLRSADVVAGPWPEPIERALVVPIRTHDSLAGVFVAGINPRRPFDAGYRAFLELVASHIGTAIADARAYEHERERIERLAELDRAKTAFFWNASHEFRTPLTLLLAPIEQLAAQVDDPLRGQVDLIRRNALRLQKLVNTLLDFARIEAGRAHARYEALDLAALTRDLASSFRSAIEAEGLTFTVDCEELAEPVWVDRDMWEKIVLNLLSNALKFTFAGGITVALRAEGDRARLEVSDTGEGIAASELPRVFEPFHRIEGQRARSIEGSGIGLAVVHELVRMHGGEVTATSELGRGSTFIVRIPRGERRTEHVRDEVPLMPSSPAAFLGEASSWARGETSIRVPHARARILLADDNADMRAYVSGLLGTEWSVTAVADGEQALASALAAPPDLVVTDVMMPGLDGVELLRRLRDDPRTQQIPVIMVSACTGEEARIGGLQAGADDYLGKPFSARELLARVRTNLELSRSRVAAAHAAARSQAKDELLAMLGHELRNPLAPLMTTLQVVAMTGRVEREQITMMQRQVTHLTRLIHDLMDMSRIVLGNVELHLEPTDLAQVITQGVDLMAHLFDDERQLDLQLRRGIFVRADATRLAQVVASVLHNAVKFSPLASHIVITSERIGDRARLEIIDQGEGIAPEIMDRLFEPFFQGKQDLARSRGGLGVGLALARGIVELHGGTIAARSAGVGRGSAFIIELPVDTAFDVKTREHFGSAESPRVLVVDDNVETAAALSLGLQLFGYRVETAHSGDEALRVAEEFAPEIALLDIGLARGMDGYELGRRLRERRDVRLYAISGYSRASDIERSREAGFAEHLVKPLDLNVVARMLRAGAE